MKRSPKSSALRRVRSPSAYSGRVAPVRSLIARYAHACSRRGSNDLVPVDCPSIAISIAEAELFGFEAGAFSGAVRRRRGLVEVADGGTLFLDEVGDLAVELQSKLLRVLGSGEYRLVGSGKARKSNFYLISATNQDLENLAREGRFRMDLLYRLGVRVYVPSLRERREDIPLIWDFLLSRSGPGSTAVLAEDGVQEILADYDWPGNVREMMTVAARAICMASNNLVTAELVESVLREGAPSPCGKVRDVNRQEVGTTGKCNGHCREEAYDHEEGLCKSSVCVGKNCIARPGHPC